jgi:hypothetical protein
MDDKIFMDFCLHVQCHQNKKRYANLPTRKFLCIFFCGAQRMTAQKNRPGGRWRRLAQGAQAAGGA